MQAVPTSWRQGMDSIYGDVRNWKGEVKTFPDVKAGWADLEKLIALGFDAKLSNPPIGFMDNNALCELFGEQIGTMVERVEGNIKELLTKTEKKLSQLSDSNDRATLATTAAAIVSTSDAAPILVRVREAIKMRNLNFAFCLLNGAKAVGKLDGTEGNIDADFYAAINLPEVYEELKEWRSLLAELVRFHQAAIDSARGIALNQWGSLLNFIIAQAGQYERLYNERIGVMMGAQFSVKTMTLRRG